MLCYISNIPNFFIHLLNIINITRYYNKYSFTWLQQWYDGHKYPQQYDLIPVVAWGHYHIIQHQNNIIIFKITSGSSTAHISVVRGQVCRLVARGSHTSVTRKLQKYFLKWQKVLQIRKRSPATFKVTPVRRKLGKGIMLLRCVAMYLRHVHVWIGRWGSWRWEGGHCCWAWKV